MKSYFFIYIIKAENEENTMATNELAIRFTEESYATKAEVSRELRMSLIDNIWSNILKYRASYYRYLSLKSIDKNQLMVCYCQSVGNNINVMDSKLLKQMGEYMKIEKANGNLSHFEDLCLISSLKQVAHKHGIDISDIHLRSLIQGDLREVPLDKRILRRYLSALRLIKKKYDYEINIDFLADVYSAFTENPELTSFYRESEDKNPNNRVLIDRIYTSAPVNLIENLMNSLFSFISTSSLSSVVKSIITYYFINYVQPFPEGNEEIALLMMKAVLANGALSEFGVVFPLENLLNINSETFNKVCIEVQKTNDLTYFVNLILKALNASLDDLANIKANFSTDVVRKDFYREDPVEQPVPPQETVITTYNDLPPTPPVQPVVEEIKPVVEQKPVEQPKPVVEQPKPAPQPKVAVETPAPVTHELAVQYIPETLDEKAAKRLEEHLLEMDPALKKGEAYFYARHCTMHMNYTIQQYKKALGCAYETARTSMDHLAELHYYEKNQIKNKFVYTPIKR